MSDIVVRSFHEFHDALGSYRNDTLWIFRGHVCVDWKLIPKAGRDPYSTCDDMEMFDHWKRRAVEYTTIAPKDDWDWLAIAQHHGLATRLLDWTTNPLVAAFFAVCDEAAVGDSVVYAYHSTRVVICDNVSPREFEGIVKFRPRGVAARLVRQEGLFTLHGPPLCSLSDHLEADDKLDRIVIASSSRLTLLYELFQYGVTFLSLFPRPRWPFGTHQLVYATFALLPAGQFLPG